MKLYFILILAVSFFFFLMISSVYVHENFHKFEMRNIEKVSEDICVSLTADCRNDGWGHYHFVPANEQEYEKALEIEKGWEERAYVVQGVYCSCLILFSFPVWRRIL